VLGLGCGVKVGSSVGFRVWGLGRVECGMRGVGFRKDQVWDLGCGVHMGTSLI